MFFRVAGADDRESRFSAAIDTVRNGTKSEIVYRSNQTAFATLPYAVYAYWASARIRRLFVQLRSVREHGVAVQSGAKTLDDGRFIRLSWEISPRRKGDVWKIFSKGGDYSPYYGDIHLLLDWKNEAAALAVGRRIGPHRLMVTGSILTPG
jgi:hypothetical protein